MSRRKALTWIWGALWVGCATVSAQAANWADGLFAEHGHDFGTVPRGVTVRHPFVVTNRLNEPITILNVRASCGCTSGKANAGVVAPGQSALVEAEMDTRNFVDRKETTLFVTMVTASGREAEARLAVSSTILSDVVLNPGTIDFGAVSKGQTPSQVLTIDRIGSGSWRVERMVSASRSISATMVESNRDEKSVSYTLTVSLRPDAPVGTIRDEIRILTNDKETASIPVQVTAQVRGELTASPNPLALGAVNSSGTVQGRFVVRAAKPFALQAIEGATDGFHMYESDATSRPTHVVTLIFKPEEATARGDIVKTFRILTDLPGEAALELTATLHIDP